MRVRKLLALTLAMMLVLGSFTFAFGSTDGFAHAWQESNSQWLFSNVKGWEEGDWIPVRIDPEIGDNEVTVELFYTDGSNIGFDSAKDWFVGYTTESSINAVDVIDNSPTVTGPTKEGDNLRYTIDIPESYSNVSVYGYIHASVTGSKSLYDDSDILTGSSDWSGSSLHMRYVGPNQSRDVSFNIMEGDTVPDPTGSITINKNIEVEDEAVHEGVQFNLTHTSNGDGVLTGYTDSNGELMFNDLPV